MISNSVLVACSIIVFAYDPSTMFLLVKNNFKCVGASLEVFASPAAPPAAVVVSSAFAVVSSAFLEEPHPANVPAVIQTANTPAAALTNVCFFINNLLCAF